VNVLITGGKGFIGSHVVDAGLAAGYTIAVVDDLSAQSLVPQWAMGHKAQTENIMNIAKMGLLNKSAFRPDCVIHMAARKKSANVGLAAFMDDNTCGTANVCNYAVEAGAKRLVYISTGSVYGESWPELRPTSDYGISKLAGEKVCEWYANNTQLEVVILRLFHVIGPRQDFSSRGGVLPQMCYRLATGQDLVVYGDGEQERLFTPVEHVVAKIWLHANSTVTGAQDVCSNVVFTINDLVRLIDPSIQCNIVYAPAQSGDVKRFIALDDSDDSVHEKVEEYLCNTIDWYADLFSHLPIGVK
jgi:UDP-glucose 4-epimerase